MLDEAQPAGRAAASAARPATATRAWSGPSPTPRWSASTPRSHDPNVTLLTNAYVTQLETERVRAGGDAPRRRARRGDRDATRRTWWWCRRARSTRRRCCCARPATDTRAAWPTARTWSGRHYMGHVNSVLMAISRCPNPTVFQKTLGAQRLLFRLAGVGVPDGPHLVRGQARRRHPAGRGARDRARVVARPDGQALARLLAHVGGPARSGQPGDARSRRATSCWPTGRTTRPRTGV